MVTNVKTCASNPMVPEASTPIYRMVALDLDGTLLGPDHMITKASVDYLRSLHKKGFIISIATGRSAAATADVIYSLNLPFEPSVSSEDKNGIPVICVNGAKGMKVLVKDSNSDDSYEKKHEKDDEKINGKKESNPMLDGRLVVSEIFHEPVLDHITKSTLSLAKEHGHTVNYYVDHYIYAQPTHHKHEVYIRDYMNLTGVYINTCEDDYEEAMKLGPPSKLLVLTGEKRLDEAVATFQKELGNEATVIRGSPPFFVEILNKTVCKGFGLQRMCKSLGVSLKECIAFGDGDNDREFIQMAGLGIAMKNARQNVKELADQVTEFTNAEDGVILTLKQLDADGLLHFKQKTI